MAVELATAYLSLVPSLRDGGKIIRQQLGSADVQSATKSAGSRIGGWLTDGLKTIGKASLAGIGLAAGTAITLGIQRALNIENAEAKLLGLGHSAEAVAGIMDNALASVKGTAFGLGEAATTAAGAVAAGVKPGQDLESVLKLVADAATIAGTDMGSMGAVFNKVAASNKIQGDVIAQLGDQGIPILQFLASQMGVTAEEASKMASAGKVDFETFREAMEAGLGGAALESGNTTIGAFKNVMAALGRAGESFISGVFPMFKDGFQGLQGLLDGIGPAAENAGKILGTALRSAVEWFKTEALPRLREFGDWFKTDGLAALRAFGDWLRDNLLPVVQDVVGWVRDDALPAIRGFAEQFQSGTGASGRFRDILIGVGNAVRSATEWLIEHRKLVVGVLGAYVAWKAISATVRGVQAAVAAFRAVQLGLTAATYGAQGAMVVAGSSARVYGVAMNVLGIKTAIVTGAQKAAAAAQWLLNAAMSANPIGLVVVAIAALVAGLVIFFTKTETGRKIWETVWGAIKSAAASVVDWFNNTALPILSAVWDGIKTAASVAWTVLKVIFVALATAVTLLVVRPMQFLWKNVIVPVWAGIRKAIGAAWGWINKYVFTPIKAGLRLLQLGFNAYLTVVKTVWTAVRTAIGGAWTWVRDKVFAPVKAGVALVGDKFDSFKQTTVSAWNGIKGPLKTAWEWVRDNVFAKFEPAVAAIGDAFESVKGVIKTAWDKIKAIAAKPVNFVIESVYMNGIKKTWDSIADAVGLDLHLPAISPIAFANGTEDHRAQIARAGAMRVWAEPETGGEAYIPLAASKRGRSTGILGAVANKFGYSLTPFANGGFFGSVGDWISNAASNVADFASTIANFLSDPAQGIKDLILKPAEALFKDVMGGPLGEMLVELPKKVITGLIDKAVSMLGGGGSAGGGFAGDPGKWVRPSKGRITSGFGPRWGAFHNGTDFAGAPGRITSAVGAGKVSKIGWNVGYGNTGFNVMVDHGGGWESLYGHNPVGGVVAKLGQIVAAGSRIGTEGATGNVTGIHLHNSMFKNGRAVNPLSLYDNGGMLPDGGIGLNLSGRPEAVLTHDETAALKAGLVNSAPLVGQLIVRDERTAVTELQNMQRRQNTQARLRAAVV